MKVEYMDPFVQAANLVLDRVSGGGAKPGSLGMVGTTFQTASVNLTSRVSGSLAGDVVLSMSSMTARKIAVMITGIEAHDFGRRMGVGLAELGRLIASQTEELLSEQGYECEISGPTIFQGLNVEFTSISPALVVPISTSVGEIDVSVAVYDDKQN